MAMKRPGGGETDGATDGATDGVAGGGGRGGARGAEEKPGPRQQAPDVKSADFPALPSDAPQKKEDKDEKPRNPRLRTPPR